MLLSRMDTLHCTAQPVSSDDTFDVSFTETYSHRRSKQLVTWPLWLLLDDIAETKSDGTLPFRGLFVCLSVCHVRTLCSNGTRFLLHTFAYNIPMSLPDRIKIWLTSVNPFLRKFWHKLTHSPVDLSFGDIRRQFAAEWLQIAQRSQRKSETIQSLFLMVLSLTPFDLPFYQNGGPKCIQDQLFDACCHLANMI